MENKNENHPKTIQEVQCKNTGFYIYSLYIDTMKLVCPYDTFIVCHKETPSRTFTNTRNLNIFFL